MLTGGPPRMPACPAATPSIDKLFEVDRLIKGDIHRPLGLVATAGGKGLNVARAAHTLGGEATAVSLLRGHAGKWLGEQPPARGVPGGVGWSAGENPPPLPVADRGPGGLT